MLSSRYYPLICSKNTWGKGELFNKWYQQNWISNHKRIKLDSYAPPVQKTNLKWIKDLNVKPKAPRPGGQPSDTGEELSDYSPESKRTNQSPSCDCTETSLHT